MAFHYALLYIKGGWSEYGSTVGLPTWGANIRPCFSCNVAPTDMYAFVGISPAASCEQFQDNVEEEYEASCRGCEHWVDIDKGAHDMLCQLLTYDFRGHGRVLVGGISSIRPAGRVEAGTVAIPRGCCPT